METENLPVTYIDLTKDITIDEKTAPSEILSRNEIESLSRKKTVDLGSTHEQILSPDYLVLSQVSRNLNMLPKTIKKAATMEHDNQSSIYNATKFPINDFLKASSDEEEEEII